MSTLNVAAPPVVPFIPDTAPFSEEQRAWLNGFLAGIYSNAALAASSASTERKELKIAVLYASQSGTAEGLARKTAKELKAKGHVATLTSLEGYTPASLASERHAIFVVSTYGEGDPPDAAQPFYNQLCVEHFPRYDSLLYSVLALGDSNYEEFCRFGRDLDEKLASLGATRIAERVDCDVELDQAFEQWKSALYAGVEKLTRSAGAEPDQHMVARSAKPSAAVAADRAWSRSNPFLAPLLEKRPLTEQGSSKLTLHMAYSIDAEVTYEAGDACGVVAQNEPRLVAEILDVLGFSGDVMVQLPKQGAATLYDALLNSLQVTQLTRKMVDAYATIGRSPVLAGLLVPDRQVQLDTYTYDRGLLDLLHEYPNVLREPADLVAMLPALAPRLYSISSSPKAHAGEIHTTVAVVRYQAHQRERGGVCSTMLADRVSPGERVPVYIQPNKKFRVPESAEAPMIMIGPGTGIAPFRAFLHERRAVGATGKNWLFFGERSASTDFLYRAELQAMQEDRFLSRLDLAFSRDQEKKVYVQDRMLEHGAMFWAWLQDGASVYVCGDASRMAKDVDATLHRIVEQHGRMDSEAAVEYVQSMKDQHKYHRDVY